MKFYTENYLKTGYFRAFSLMRYKTLLYLFCIFITSSLSSQTFLEVGLITTSDLNITSHNTFGMCADGNQNSFFLASNDHHENVAVYQVDFEDMNNPVISTIDIDATSASMSPALVNYNGTLYIFYRENDSSGDDEQIYYKKYESDGSWSSQTAPEGVKAQTDHTPTVLVYDSKLYLFNKENRHHFLGEAWMTGNESWSSNNNVTYYDSDIDDIEWGWPLQSSSNNVDSVEDDSDDDQYVRNQIVTLGSSEYPYGVNPCQPRDVAATMNSSGEIMLTFKGGTETSDTKAKQIYSMTRNNSDGTWNQAEKISNFESKYAPTLIYINTTLVCIFSNDSDQDKLYYSIYNPSNLSWGTSIKLSDDELGDPHNKASDPLAVVLNGSTIAVTHLDNSDNAVLKFYNFQE